MKTTLIFNLLSFELFVRRVQETLQITQSIAATLGCHPCIYGGHPYILGCHPAFQLSWNRKVFWTLPKETQTQNQPQTLWSIMLFCLQDVPEQWWHKACVSNQPRSDSTLGLYQEMDLILNTVIDQEPGTRQRRNLG